MDGAESKGNTRKMGSLLKSRHGTGSCHSHPHGQSKPHSHAQSLRSRKIHTIHSEAVERWRIGVNYSVDQPESPPTLKKKKILSLEQFETCLLKGFFFLHFLCHQSSKSLHFSLSQSPEFFLFSISCLKLEMFSPSFCLCILHGSLLGPRIFLILWELI